jgi:hypothetical protein
VRASNTHVWLARVSTRTVMATGCPACSRLSGEGGANKGRKCEEAPTEGRAGSTWRADQLGPGETRDVGTHVTSTSPVASALTPNS